MKPSQVAKFRPQHLMLFGDPKSGKSTLAAKLLTKGYNLTWISMDNGHDILFKMGLSDEFLDEHLNIVILPDTKEQPVAIATCLKIASGAEVNICDKHGQVDCSSCKRVTEATWSKVHCNNFGPKDVIVYDHLGQLANSAMARIFIKGKKSDDDKPEWDDYFAQGSLIDRFLTNIQQAHYNVVCITHVIESEMEDGAKKLLPLVGTTNFSRNAGKYFDHVIYCHMQNSTHKFGSSTTYQNRVVTGSRADVAIEKLAEPSLVPFFDGTIGKVELAGAEVAKKLLATSEKKPIQSQESMKELVGKVEEKFLETASVSAPVVSKPAAPEQPQTITPIPQSIPSTSPKLAVDLSITEQRLKALALLKRGR